MTAFIPGRQDEAHEHTAKISRNCIFRDRSIEDCTVPTTTRMAQYSNMNDSHRRY